jgi:hypothetical protein
MSVFNYSQTIVVKQGFYGKYYILHDTAYDINFSLDTAIKMADLEQTRMGVPIGPQYCRDCRVDGCVNGVFTTLCGNCDCEGFTNRTLDDETIGGLLPEDTHLAPENYYKNMGIENVQNESDESNESDCGCKLSINRYQYVLSCCSCGVIGKFKITMNWNEDDDDFVFINSTENNSCMAFKKYTNTNTNTKQIFYDIYKPDSP